MRHFNQEIQGRNLSINMDPSWSQLKSCVRVPVADWLSCQNVLPMVNKLGQTMVALEEVALHTVNPSTLALAQNGCPVVSAHRRGNHSKNVEVQDVKCQEPVYCVKCRSLRILIL